MKTLIIAATAAIISSSAFANTAPVYSGDYSASVEQSLNRANDDAGEFRFGFSSEASARSTSDGSMDSAWFGNLGNYSSNVTAEAFHR